MRLNFLSYVIVSFFIASLLWSSLFLFAIATDYSSGNFISRDPVMTDFGGNSTSTSFEDTSAGGQVATGESTSTNFILRSGFLYFDAYQPKTQNWKWFDDEENETPTNPLADENVAPVNITNQNIIKLRTTVKETSGYGEQNAKFRLQYSQFSDFSQGVFYATEIMDCTSGSGWCYADGGGGDNATITTAYEFTIKRSGANPSSTFFFRLYDTVASSSVSLNTGETYPSLSTAGGVLTFTVSGLSASTVTEGVTTDIGTTPTDINFGLLPLGTELTAAQRTSVTTDATHGYEIFTYEHQGFIGNGGQEIQGVSATNDSPAGWGTACVSSSPGCFGYHAGDDTLSGSVARFAPNDTFAKFETAMREIAYSSGPVTNDDNDIIFKTQITNQQDAGDYSTSIVYIIVPTF
ncbi:MAG: hypothetical protein UX72_C0028G0010 [Parcubacteria group bacterium GW2011_GWA2_47_10]|nr:MAG: hypothetical protein UX72_C0028G0010 [Parcubacteria group bacterium GW2011_GWA2_47_10]